MIGKSETIAVVDETSALHLLIHDQPILRRALVISHAMFTGIGESTTARTS
jgi:hypothetical protein